MPVFVRLGLDRQRSEVTGIKALLERTGSGWRVANLVHGNGGSVAKNCRESLDSARQRR